MRKQRVFNCTIILLAWLAVCSASIANTGQWKLVDEYWYTIEFNGSKAGWMSTKVWTDGTQFRSEMQQQFSVSRGSKSVKMEFQFTWIETLDGKPVSLRSLQQMSAQPVDIYWKFMDKNVIQTTRQGGREVVKEVPLPKPGWLTPMAVQRYWNKQRNSGAELIKYSTIIGNSGLKANVVRHKYVGQEEFQSEDGTIPVTLWRTRTDAVQQEAKELYTLKGVLVQQQFSMPMLDMLIRLTSKEKAQAKSTGPRPELLVSTMVRPSRRINRVKGSTTATYKLKVNEGKITDLPSAGSQRVVMGDDGSSATLTININQPQSIEDGADLKNYLESSAMIDCKDERIVQLADKAVYGMDDDDLLAKAVAMHKFTNRYISSKDLNTAFASASEVAQFRSGDCSEHAVLLCALLRAEQIPARVAMGLIYVDSFMNKRNVFGWHMWTQALINGKWIDLDATLPIRYHAGHILTSTTDLSSGAMGDDLMSALNLIGNLQIEVVDVGYEKKK